MKDKTLQIQLEIVIDQLKEDHPDKRAFAGTVQQAIKKIEQLEAELNRDKMKNRIISKNIKCQNCSNYRTVDDGSMVAQCKVCGDDEFELYDIPEVPIPVEV